MLLVKGAGHSKGLCTKRAPGQYGPFNSTSRRRQLRARQWPFILLRQYNKLVYTRSRTSTAPTSSVPAGCRLLELAAPVLPVAAARRASAIEVVIA